jgi:predicted NAD-dependent protein-ADP-ribosyltransferase YbiA (DUF1768 family)
MTRKRLNIRSDSSDWRAAILSNLAPTPFMLEGITFPCVESALQGIKFEDEGTRNEIFAMDGLPALKKGREVTKSLKHDVPAFVYWQDDRYGYNSSEHQRLIQLFIREKVAQNPRVQEALLATEGDFIYHDVGPEHPNTSFPENLFIAVLLAERKSLRMDPESSVMVGKMSCQNGKKDKCPR